MGSSRSETTHLHVLGTLSSLQSAVSSIATGVTQVLPVQVPGITNAAIICGVCILWAVCHTWPIAGINVRGKFPVLPCLNFPYLFPFLSSCFSCSVFHYSFSVALQEGYRDCSNTHWWQQWQLDGSC